MPATQGIPISQIQDVAVNTLNQYERARWVSIVPDYTEYVIMQLLEMAECTEAVTGMMPYQWQVQVEGIDTLQHVGAYSKISLQGKNVGQAANVRARASLEHFIFDLNEQRAQEGDKKLIDLVEEKFNAMREATIQTIEALGWSVPAESDNFTPWGFPVHIVMYDSGDSTPENGGFLGTNPYSAGATWTNSPNGLSKSTYTKNRNYAAKYSSVTFDDMVTKLRKAADLTHFKAPNPFAQLIADAPGDVFDRALYFPHTVKQGIEDLSRKQRGDNNTGDLAVDDGQVKFRGRLGWYVPYLDDVTGAPIYGINHKACPLLLDKEQFGKRVYDGPVGAEQPETIARVYKYVWGACGREVRRCFVLSTTNKQGT